jgi:hypothetical protein
MSVWFWSGGKLKQYPVLVDYGAGFETINKGLILVIFCR